MKQNTEETQEFCKKMEGNAKLLMGKKERLLELYNLSKQLELEEQQKAIGNELSELCERIDDMYSELEYIKRREERQVKGE